MYPVDLFSIIRFPVLGNEVCGVKSSTVIKHHGASTNQQARWIGSLLILQSCVALLYYSENPLAARIHIVHSIVGIGYLVNKTYIGIVS